MAHPGKGRKKVTLLNRVRQQMEFYFGDASLSKDRFLQEKIKGSEDGYVPVSLFLKFNKLRTITAEESIIREAIKGSSVLELSSDGINVRRSAPLSDTGPVDERTLYVENIPNHADHEWLKSKFSVFGAVQYVSLPRFKALNAIKGFAFIEFDSPDAVQKAEQYFASPPTTAAAYEKEAALPVAPTVTVNDFDEDELSAKHGQKRKHDDISLELSDGPVALPDTGTSSAKRLESESVQSQMSTVAHRKDGRKLSAKDLKPSFSPELLPLKVMPKVRWTELKKRYLEMQKASYKAIKQKLKMLNVDDGHAEENGLQDDDNMLLDSDEEEEVPKNVTKKRAERPQRRDQEMPRRQVEKMVMDKAESKPELSFTPGVIIHLAPQKPFEDKKKVIQEFRAVPHVAFVDAGSLSEIFLRCDNVDGVKDAMGKLMENGENVLRVLEGEEETNYWNKIRQDMAKRSSMANRHRGKPKVRDDKPVDVVRNAERIADTVARNSHIKFD